MNQKLKKATLFAGAAASSLLGSLILWQKACFWQAQKKTEDTLFEIYASPFGDITYTSVGHGQPLLLLHSMMPGASHKEWDSSALAEQFHVYALDLPGFGDSFSPKKPWTAYQYAQCLPAFLKDVIRRPAFVLAANGGADLALVTAMLHPENIKGLMLISPEGFGHGFPTNGDVKPLHKLLFPILGTQCFLMETTKGSIKKELEQAFFAKEKIAKERLDIIHQDARKNPKHQTTFAALKTGFWRADTKAAFSSLSMPFWVLWGEENKTNPVSNMTWAEAARPDGDYIIFEGTGAFPHWENSQAFLDIVKEYLK